MNKIKIFMKNNSSIILGVLSAAGVIYTTVTAIKATPKAMTLIEEKKKKEEKENLSITETVKTVWKPYVPTSLGLVFTLSCIFGNSYISKKTQISLISAYSLLNKSYKEYIDKAKKIYGEDSDMNIKEEIAKSNYDYNEEIENDEKLFFDYQTLRYFTAKIEDVLEAEKMVNAELAATGYVSVNDFYKFIGIEPLPYCLEMGWSDNGDYHEIEFTHQRTVMDDGSEDGLECWMIIANDGLTDYPIL